MLEGWGRFVHRRRWAVLGASLAMLALSGVLLAQGGDLGNPDTIPTTESGRASQLLSTELPRPTGVPTGASFTLVFRSETLAVADPAYRQAVTDALVPLRGDPRVTSIRTYYDAPTPSLLSRDGHGMLGSFDVVREGNTTPPADAPTVRITGTAYLGSIEIKVIDPNAPTWTEKLKSGWASLKG